MTMNALPTLLRRLTALAIGSALGLSAAPLSKTTAVHTLPDATAAVITTLKAGTEPVAAPDPGAGIAAGWMAIELQGPFEAYVENKDLTKSLDVKPGASIRLAPSPEGGVLAVGNPADKTKITGLRGRWTQISLERPIVGYIRLDSAALRPPPLATTPAVAPAAAPPPAPAPVTPAVAAAGRPALTVERGDSGGGTLPRQFAGQFVSTRRPFAPRRPYDYALNDEAGRRYAYLDISKLLLTDQIENYVGRAVVVFGTARTPAGSQDIVVVVEALRLP